MASGPMTDRTATQVPQPTADWKDRNPTLAPHQYLRGVRRAGAAKDLAQPHLAKGRLGQLVEVALRALSPSVNDPSTYGLTQLLAQAKADQKSVLQKQIEIVIDVGRRNIPQQHDLEDLEKRAIIALGSAGTSKT
jgi:hypothetical protein